jgi:hypothetical protein
MNRAKGSFLEPEVKQYGSHMVMTNVSRNSKRKFINIDSKYRDEYGAKYLDTYQTYNTNYPANFNITLPERINDVKSIIVCNAEIPMSFYNISGTLGNNYFKIINGSSFVMIQVPSGEYTPDTLVTAINAKINASGVAFANRIVCSISGNRTTFTTASDAFIIEFDVDETGSADPYHFKDKLGWLLGFRKQSYNIPSSTTTTSSENVVDINTIRYLYLVLDEYTKGNQNSFISPMRESLIRKNIIAKITLNKTMFRFGDILPANNVNGYLLTLLLL